jgi:hypothetical protein
MSHRPVIDEPNHADGERDHDRAKEEHEKADLFLMRCRFPFISHAVISMRLR